MCEAGRHTATGIGTGTQPQAHRHTATAAATATRPQPHSHSHSHSPGHSHTHTTGRLATNAPVTRHVQIQPLIRRHGDRRLIVGQPRTHLVWRSCGRRSTVCGDRQRTGNTPCHRRLARSVFAPLATERLRPACGCRCGMLCRCRCRCTSRANRPLRTRPRPWRRQRRREREHRAAGARELALTTPSSQSTCSPMLLERGRGRSSG